MLCMIEALSYIKGEEVNDNQHIKMTIDTANTA